MPSREFPLPHEPVRTAPVVFAGAVTLDAIALVNGYPQPDERQVAEAVVHAGGGPAATAAVTAARLGVPAALAGAVGDDDEGARILGDLRAEGVDVTGVRVVPEHASGVSVVLVDRASGTRTISTCPGPPPQIAVGSDVHALVREAPWVHVDHLGWEPVTALLPEAAESRPRLSVDAGNPIPGFDPRGVDVLAPTVAWLRRQYGDRTPGELLDAALVAGAGCVVATAGSSGAIASTEPGERCQAPAYPVDAVSTLGAGDVFHGGLIAGFVREMPLLECLRYANVVAALSCLGLDGRSAAPAHEDVLAHLATAREEST